MPQQPSIDSLVDLKKASIEKWSNKIFVEKKLNVECLRLDLIHPIISGNKWFKLKNYFRRALDERKKGILSAGGAWSNHLNAISYACMKLGLPSVAAIRGERPATYSITLKDLEDQGTELEFIPRTLFREEAELSKLMMEKFPGYLWVPVGGSGSDGIEGVKEVANFIDLTQYSHLVCAVGTGTFLTGLMEINEKTGYVLGICSLKIKVGDKLIEESINSKNSSFSINYDYHFGGLGKYNNLLLDYMNDLFRSTGIPTDFIYTGKLFYAAEDLAKKDFFPSGSNILILHSGGLQGNRSLPVKRLVF